MVYRTFTQTYDMNTEQGAPVLLGIHTPIGGDASRFLEPFFQAYKKFKYVGCDVTIVNAARLPVDPEQLGKIAGTNYVDPRDTLNPMMFKGCHGENLGRVLDSMYGGLASDIFKLDTIDKETFNSVLESFYYTALGDDAWKKSPIQKTLHLRGLHPLCYQMATTHQIMPTGDIRPEAYPDNTYPETAGDTAIQPSFGQTLSGAKAAPVVGPTAVYDPYNNLGVSKFVGSFFTNKLTSLGWLDTLQFLGSQDANFDFDKAQITQLPKLFMGLLLLPPSYLCRQYLRVIIKHKYRFSGYRTITTGGAFDGFTPVNGTPWGYTAQLTINGPEGSKTTNSLLVRESAADPLTGSDLTDYDAIEEVDDESCN